jgi:hypothetical protein
MEESEAMLRSLKMLKRRHDTITCKHQTTEGDNTIKLMLKIHSTTGMR